MDNTERIAREHSDVTRRYFLQIGAAGVAASSVSKLWAAEQSGQTHPLLAEAISVALVTTFWGLLVGIPALFFYGMFQTRIEVFISEAAIETDSLLARIFEAPNAGPTDKVAVDGRGTTNEHQ